MQISNTRWLIVLCLLATTLSGCASKETFLSLIDFSDENPYEEIFLLESEQTIVPPAELLPEPVESDTCIVQELDALRQTGSWVEKEISEESQELKYDFPVVINKQVKMYLDLFQHKQKKYFSRWLSRSTRYLPFIHVELKKAGLPLDLAYLAMIESGFNQRAYSRARAVGLWQFMKGTGRGYNLKIDRYVDERRDFEKSTRAAIAFLGDLHQQFGDWHLAVSAYNAGPGKIRRGLKRYKTNNFWELAEKKYLRLETKRYVPKLIAAILIATDPEKYGFVNINYLPPMQYDTLEVGPGLSLDALALISGGTKKEVLLLNQELKTGRTPLNQRRYMANIPKGSIQLAKANLSRLHSVVKTGYTSHIIRQGETLTTICKKYNVNKTTILKVNNLRTGTLTAGKRLRIPYSTVSYQLLAQKGSGIAQATDNLILHKILPGETISKIANKYEVPPEMIVEWNGLKSVHRIRAGQQLALYILDDRGNTATIIKPNKIKGKTGISPSPEANKIVLADTKKKRPAAVAANGQGPTFNWYQVKAGDTLWKISRRFNTSPKEIKRWNNLKSNLIHPGSKLKLKDV